MKDDIKEYTEHHIFCNYFANNPKDCKQCQDLRNRFPESDTDEIANEIIAKLFPDVIKR